MTLKECVEEIIEKRFLKDDYFDSHTIINIILSIPEYRLIYMKEYSSDCDLKQHHAKIANCIRFSSFVKSIGDKNSKSFNVFGVLSENQLWQKN